MLCSALLTVRNPIRGKFSATKAKAVKKILLCAALTLLVSVPQFFSVHVVLKDPSLSLTSAAPNSSAAVAIAPRNRSSTITSADTLHPIAPPLGGSLGTAALSGGETEASRIAPSTTLPGTSPSDASAVSQRTSFVEISVSYAYAAAAENESSALVEKQAAIARDPCARQRFDDVEPIATVLRTIGYSYIGQFLFTIIPLVLLTTLNALLVVHTLRYSRRRKRMAHAHVCFENHQKHPSARENAAHTVTVSSCSTTNRQKNGSVKRETSGSGSSAGGVHNASAEPTGTPDSQAPNESPFNNRKASVPQQQQQQHATATLRIHQNGSSVVVAAGCPGGIAAQTAAVSSGNRRKTLIATATSFRRVESNVAREQHKITRMLILIVVFFLLCHLPQLIGTLWKEYVERVGSASRSSENARRIFGNVSNACLQINCVANFVFYSLLSTKFYSTLQSIFLGLCRRRRRSSLAAMVAPARRVSYAGEFASLAPGITPLLGPAAPIALELEQATSTANTSCTTSYTLDLHACSNHHVRCDQHLLRPLAVRFSIPAAGALHSKTLY